MSHKSGAFLLTETLPHVSRSDYAQQLFQPVPVSYTHLDVYKRQGVVFPVMAIIQALGFFCGHGSGNSISRHLGSKDIQSARELAATGFFLAFALGILLMVLGLSLIHIFSYSASHALYSLVFCFFSFFFLDAVTA